MARLTPRGRKELLALHLTASVGWLGAAAVFLVVVLVGRGSPDPDLLRSTWRTLDTVGWTVLVPMATTSLLTGVLMGLGTHWGLLQHYWVTVSLTLTTLATAVLIGNMLTVRSIAVLAAAPAGDDLATMRSGLDGELLHAGLGIVVLLVVQVLNVLKPRGRTRRGHRLATGR